MIRITEEIAQTLIQTTDIETLWNAYNAIILNSDEYDIHEHEQVKNGIYFKFNIHEVISKKYSEKTKTGHIIFNKQHRTLPWESFYEELDARKAIMIRTIYNNINQKAPIIPRQH